MTSMGSTFTRAGRRLARQAATLAALATLAATLPGGNGITVHIAHSADGNIPHCYPSAGPGSPDPGEIAKFTRAESTSILDAVEP